MTVEELAIAVIDACESAGVVYMVTGAFAVSLYGIPRSTKDVDVVLSLAGQEPVRKVVRQLAPQIEFDPQIQFDTLTWGRCVGTSRLNPLFKVVLFELFDDPFVLKQFLRKRLQQSQQIGRACWLPTAEDVVVQKLRWGRSKDLDDARDVLAVQGPETLDMLYIKHWCTEHGTVDRLQAALDGIPPL